MSIFYMPSASAFGQHLRPSDGALLYFYDAGTTNAKTTYSDSAETIANTHPVVADSSGLFGLIYLSGTYKAVLKDKNGVQLWEEDNLTHPGGAFLYTGTFDSSTNASNYPASGDKGFAYKVSTGFTLAAVSGSHLLYTGDFIVANKDGATGIDADWDIIRGGYELVDGIIDINRGAPAPSLYIDASGNVGLRTNAPDGALHIFVADSLATSPNTANDLVLESNDDAGFSIMIPDAKTGTINFGSPDDTSGASVKYKNSDNLMTIGTNHTPGEVAFISGGSTESFRIDDTQRIIVNGTSSLVIGPNRSVFQLSGADEVTGSLAITRFETNAEAGHLKFLKSRYGTPGGGNTIVADDDLLGDIVWYADDGSDFVSSAALIKAEVDGTPGANDMPGRLVFATTADGAASSTERMRITSAGLVGIGTDSPGKALEVEDNSTNGANGILIHNTRTGTGSRSSILFQDDGDVNLFELTALGTSYSGALGSAGDFVLNGLTAQDFIFITNTSEAMRIDSSQNVGIGTDSPTEELHVQKSITGGNLTILAENTENSNAASHAKIQAKSTGASGGDPFVNFLISGIDQWSIGVDNSDSDKFKFDNGSTIGSATKLTIDTSGNVGIGTDSPGSLLSLNDTTGALLTLSRSDASILDTNTIGGILFAGGTAGSLQTRAQILSLADGAWTEGSVEPANLVFKVTTTNSAVEAMRIDKSGNVGIGTDSPDGLLHVYRGDSTATADGGADDLVLEIGGSGGLSILTPDANYSNLYFGSASINTGAGFKWNHDADLFTIRTDKAGAEIQILSGDAVEAMRIDSSGNVGIGTDSPEGTLHVMTSDASVAPSADADQGVFENNAKSGISILASDAQNAAVYFGSSTSNLGAFATWKYDTGLMELGTNKAGGQLVFNTAIDIEAMRIDSSGNVGIGTASPLSLLHLGTATEELEIVDAGSAGATEQDWIQVEVGGVTGYIRVYAAV